MSDLTSKESTLTVNVRINFITYNYGTSTMASASVTEKQRDDDAKK